MQVNARSGYAFDIGVRARERLIELYLLILHACISATDGCMGFVCGEFSGPVCRSVAVVSHFGLLCSDTFRFLSYNELERSPIRMPLQGEMVTASILFGFNICARNK